MRSDVVKNAGTVTFLLQTHLDACLSCSEIKEHFSIRCMKCDRLKSIMEHTIQLLYYIAKAYQLDGPELTRIVEKVLVGENGRGDDGSSVSKLKLTNYIKLVE